MIGNYCVWGRIRRGGVDGDVVLPGGEAGDVVWEQQGASAVATKHTSRTKHFTKPSLTPVNFKKYILYANP